VKIRLNFLACILFSNFAFYSRVIEIMEISNRLTRVSNNLEILITKILQLNSFSYI